MWSKHGAYFENSFANIFMHKLDESKDQTKLKKSTKSQTIIIGGFFSLILFFFEYKCSQQQCKLKCKRN